jgi:hypothetical protein
MTTCRGGEAEGGRGESRRRGEPWREAVKRGEDDVWALLGVVVMEYEI